MKPSTREGRPMSTPAAQPPIDLALLEQVLLAADPAVCLVPSRILRRVIKADRRLVGLGLRVPHVKSYVISRDALLKLATRGELGVPPGRDLPETVVLLVRPEPDKIAALSRDEALVLYWRLLFHARIHTALEAPSAEARLSAAGVRHRIQRLGPTEFDALRAVLRQENFLMPPRNDRTTYVEFAALYLELRHFSPALLPRYFPGLADWAGIDALLAEDVDAAEVLARSRPPGAPPDPTIVCRPDAEEARPHERAEEPLTGPPSDADYRDLLERADKARAVGNVVRAAMLRMQAAAVAQPKRVRAARNAARAELALLVDRLRPALGLSDDEAKVWRQVLPSLLAPAARGVWPAEARMLYDLQKVCVDYERDLYAADLVEWLRSFVPLLGIRAWVRHLFAGDLAEWVRSIRRPIKRPLPEQRKVLLLKHLRSAARRLRTVHLPEAERQQLGPLFQAAVTRKEKELRERFRPRILGVLDEAGLVPTNPPERVSRDKLVEELLDHVVDHGFSTIGNLRDILARSQLKLPDLTGPGELVDGDRLLRADKQLGVALDGVHRHGEIYLRLFQRVSSVAFGTRLGRFLTRYVALPFLGAYMAIVGVMEIIDVVAEYVFRVAHFHSINLMRPLVHDWAVDITGVHDYVRIPHDTPKAEATVLRHSDRLLQMEHTLSRGLLTAVLGLFFFALLHVPPFRRAVLAALTGAYRGLDALFVDLPHVVLHWPPLRRVLDSRAFALFSYYLLKPGIAAGLAGVALWLHGTRGDIAGWTTAAVFFGVNLLLNSRFGREFEEILSDGLERGWQRLSVEILPEMVNFVLDLFKRLLGTLDRVLYSVDEWLRFRGGQKETSFVAKSLLGLAWFVVAYAIRTIVVVFVEPTFNPIKHFPTVTVAAKLILPFYFDWVPLFGKPLLFLGPWAAKAFGITVFFLLPGLAGFLVWELKENWRLYAANRPRSLRPVMVGSHGETLVRLLRPGFHSGTLPKLYAKLRKAMRRAARRPGAGDTIRACQAALHHLGDNVRHFFEREFLALLNASTFWREAPLSLGAVELGANRIRAELSCPALAGAPVWLSFEERSGRLLAGVTGPGWLPRLSPEQRGALTTALAGLYQLAGVALVRQQIEALLPPVVSTYDIVDQGLAVWSEADEEAIYPLDVEEGTDAVRVSVSAIPEPLPALPVVPLLFERVEVPWDWWVLVWEGDRAGKPHPPLPVEGLRLLPAADDPARTDHVNEALVRG